MRVSVERRTRACGGGATGERRSTGVSTFIGVVEMLSSLEIITYKTHTRTHSDHQTLLCHYPLWWHTPDSR